MEVCKNRKALFFKHLDGGTITVSKSASNKNAYRKIKKYFIRESNKN